MTHTYIALNTGAVIETNVRTHDLEKLFQEEWFRVPVRGHSSGRYRLYLLRSADIRCAFERPTDFPPPWEGPDPVLARAIADLYAATGIAPHVPRIVGRAR